MSRTLTLKLSSGDGKLSAQASMIVEETDTAENFLHHLASALDEIDNRLNVLERDGPQKDNVPRGTLVV